MSKIIYRYRVTVGDINYEVPAGKIVLIAADRGGEHNVVEVWVEHNAVDGEAWPGLGRIILNIYGTGQDFRDEEKVHVGSVMTVSFVWHMYATYVDGGVEL